MERSDPIRKILEKKGKQIFSIPPDAFILDALKLMAERNVGALLVMEEKRLVGIISERDYARKVILHGKSSRDTAVSEVMTTLVTTVSPEHKVDECMAIMTEKRLRHLPVMEGGEVGGVVSIGDLVNWIISAQEESISQLYDYIVGKYPG